MVSSLGYMVRGFKGMGYLVSRVGGSWFSRYCMGYRVHGFSLPLANHMCIVPVLSGLLIDHDDESEVTTTIVSLVLNEVLSNLILYLFSSLKPPSRLNKVKRR